MNKGSLSKSFIQFKQRINDNLNLISEVNNLNSTQNILTSLHINQITELAFLKIYMSSTQMMLVFNQLHLYFRVMYQNPKTNHYK